MKQQDSASGAIVVRKFHKPHNAAEWLELVMNAVFFLCGILAVGCVALITVYMVISGLPAIGEIGIVDFLFGQEWASTAAEPKFGILPFILSSVYGTLGAIIIGIPVGLLTAVFLSKAATPKLRTAATSAIELLSGIPSVIFGLLGMQLLVPAVAAVFGRASGACLLSAILVLSIMILPSIVSVSVTALNAVPREYEEGSLALGATEAETWFKVRGHGRHDGGRQQPQYARHLQERHLPDHRHRQGDELRQRPAAAGAVQHRPGPVRLHHAHQPGPQLLPERRQQR